MSKIIRYPHKIECPYCKCLIGYSKKDIDIEKNVFNKPIEMVKCPNCGADIFIREVLSNDNL